VFQKQNGNTDTIEICKKCLVTRRSTSSVLQTKKTGRIPKIDLVSILQGEKTRVREKIAIKRGDFVDRAKLTTPESMAQNV